jgi:hypothetical protein
MISYPITAMMSDAALLGPWFSGPSWDAWRAVLKATFALPMSDEERRLFAGVAQRDPPARRVRELWVIAGRRAGKDSVASAIGTHSAAFSDYSAQLRPGEAAHVMALAVDRLQARILLRYIRAYFAGVRMLGALIERETTEGLELQTRAELSIQTNDFRSVRGRTITCAILDEVAFWRDELSASPDTETYNALVPGMATLPASLLVGITTGYRRGGLAYEKWRTHYGRASDDVLVIQATSRQLNPTLPQRVVDEALERDPAVARSEFLGEWRDDIGTFISRDLIETAVDRGIIVRPPVPGVPYVAFADPSGGMADAFTLAVAHAEGDAILLDCLVEITPPFNPTTATRDLAVTLKSYRLSVVTGDRYAAAWIVDAFAKVGVTYTHSERDRSALYADALPLFTAGRAHLLDQRRLVAQLASLERRTHAGGRDRIDHPVGGHDDAANAVAGALTLAAAGSGPMVIAPEIMARIHRNRTLRQRFEASGMDRAEYRSQHQWGGRGRVFF